MGASDVLIVILAVVLPPVAVAIRRGCGADLVINILLCLLGHIPGIIHAVWLVLRDRERRRGVVRGNAYGYGNAPAPQPQQTYVDTPADHRNQAGFIPREEQGYDYVAPQQQEGAYNEKRSLMGDEKEGLKQ